MKQDLCRPLERNWTGEKTLEIDFMKVEILFQDRKWEANLEEPIQLGIPIKPGEHPNCFFAPDIDIQPFRSGDFIGSVQAGAPVNFMNVKINPHGNGTHTESLGHISAAKIPIYNILKKHHFVAQVITVKPLKQVNGDSVLNDMACNISEIHKGIEALILRTIPNDSSKLTRDYSGNNPPYIDKELLFAFREIGIEHLLIDLPSVDREEDDGEMAGHKVWWNYPTEQYSNRTITEMIYVSEDVKDGMYLLNLQTMCLVLDAVPTNPTIYKLSERIV